MMSIDIMEPMNSIVGQNTVIIRGDEEKTTKIERPRPSKEYEEIESLIKELINEDIITIDDSDEADTNRGIGKKANQKRATTYEGLGPYQKLHSFFRNTNPKVPAENGKKRNNSEEPETASRGSRASGFSIQSYGTAGNNSGMMVGSASSSRNHDNQTYNELINTNDDVDKEPISQPQSPQSEADSVIIDGDNIENVPHERGKRKADNDKPSQRHISEIDGLEGFSNENNTLSPKDAHEPEDSQESKTAKKERKPWAPYSSYGTRSILASNSPAKAKAQQNMGRFSGGGARPINTLSGDVQTSSAPVSALQHRFNLHEGHSRNKKRKTEHTYEGGGSSRRPVDVEEDARSTQRLARSQPRTVSNGDSLPGTFMSCVPEYLSVENTVRGGSAKTRSDRRRRQSYINGSPGSQKNHGFPDQQVNSRRIRNLISPHNDDTADLIEDDESDEITSQTKPQYNGTAYHKPPREKPITRDSQTFMHFRGQHSSMPNSSNSMHKQNGTKKQSNALYGDDNSEDELLGSDIPQPRTTFGRLSKHNDTSLENRGDIPQTNFGNRGTGSQKLRQKADSKGYRVRCIFSERQYWVRPDEFEGRYTFIPEQASGDLVLFEVLKGATKPIDRFVIKLNTINKITTCENSVKLIIEKSTDAATIVGGSKVFMELYTNLEAQELFEFLGDNVKMAKKLYQPPNELHKIFHNTRTKMKAHIANASISPNKQPEQPDDIQLMESNEQRRAERCSQPSNDKGSKTRKLENGDDTNSPNLPPKRVKLNQGMRADADYQSTNKSEIPPANFYGEPGTASKTRSSLRNAARPKAYKEPPKERSPSPEGWTHANRGWDKAWTSSIIYPKTGKKTATVDKQDIVRLNDGEFLNDNLIMFYLLWLEQHNPHLADRVYIHNTFFYASLTNTARGKKGINYEAVQRWTAKIDLPSYDYIIVPVNEHTHWYVAIICNTPKLLEEKPKEALQAVGDEVETDPEIKRASRDGSKPLIPRESSPQSSRSASVALGTDVNAGVGKEDLPLQDEAQIREIVGEMIDVSLEEILPPSHHGLLGVEFKDDGLDTADVSTVSTPVVDIPHSTATTGKPIHLARGKKKFIVPTRVHDPKQPRVITFDSLGMAHSQTCRNLKDYIVAEIKSKRDLSITPPKQIGMTAKHIPQQDNYCDCGVYVLGYMEEFFKRPDAFIQEIIESKYEQVVDSSYPKSLRDKVRTILCDLAEAQAQETLEAQKAKQEKSRSKKVPPKDGSAKVEPSKSQPASRDASKSARASPMTDSRSANMAKSKASETPAVASKALQTPKASPKEIINLDDSQDTLPLIEPEFVSSSPIHAPVKDLQYPHSQKSTAKGLLPNSTESKRSRSSSFPEEIYDSHGDQGESTQESHTDVKLADNIRQMSQSRPVVLIPSPKSLRQPAKQSSIINDDDEEVEEYVPEQSKGGRGSTMMGIVNGLGGLLGFGTAVDSTSSKQQSEGARPRKKLSRGPKGSSTDANLDSSMKFPLGDETSSPQRISSSPIEPERNNPSNGLAVSPYYDVDHRSESSRTKKSPHNKEMHRTDVDLTRGESEEMLLKDDKYGEGFPNKPPLIDSLASPARNNESASAYYKRQKQEERFRNRTMESFLEGNGNEHRAPPLGVAGRASRDSLEDQMIAGHKRDN